MIVGSPDTSVSTADLTDLAGSIAQLGVALGGLWMVVRLVVSVQFRMLQVAQLRNKELEDRVDELEIRLSSEQENHRGCRQELHEYKLEATAQMAALQAEVNLLKQQINRPYRSTDRNPEGE